MSEYYFSPKEDITLKELTAIVKVMLDSSYFDFIPVGAERHFTEVIKEPEPEPTMWKKIGKFFL